jgi:hypothetical protein
VSEENNTMEGIYVDLSKLKSSFNQMKEEGSYPFKDYGKIEDYLAIDSKMIKSSEPIDTIDDKACSVKIDCESMHDNMHLYKDTNSLKNTNNTIGMLNKAMANISTSIDIVSQIKDRIKEYLEDDGANQQQIQDEIQQKLKEYKETIKDSTYNNQNLLNGTLENKDFYIDHEKYLSLDIKDSSAESVGTTFFLKSYNDKSLISEDEYERIKALQLQSGDKNLKDIVEDISTKFSDEYKSYFEVNQVSQKEIQKGTTDSNFAINGINIGIIDIQSGDIDGTLRDSINSISKDTNIIAKVEDSKLSLQSSTGESIAISSDSLSNLYDIGIIDTFEPSKYRVTLSEYNSNTLDDRVEFYSNSDNRLLASLDESGKLSIHDDTLATFEQDSDDILISELKDNIMIRSTDSYTPIPTDLSGSSSIDKANKSYTLDTDLLQDIKYSDTIDVATISKELIKDDGDFVEFDLSGFGSSYDDRVELFDMSDNLLASISKDGIVKNSSLDLSMSDDKLKLNSLDSDIKVKLSITNDQQIDNTTDTDTQVDTIMDTTTSSKPTVEPDTTDHFGFVWQNSEKELQVSTVLDLASNQRVSYTPLSGSGSTLLEMSKSKEESFAPIIGTLTIAKHSSASIEQDEEFVKASQIDSSKIDTYKKSLSDISVETTSQAYESAYIVDHTLIDLEKNLANIETQKAKALKYSSEIISEIEKNVDTSTQTNSSEFNKHMVVEKFKSFALSHMMDRQFTQIDRLLSVDK